MIGTLERSVATIDRRLVLLAPPQRNAGDIFPRLTFDGSLHRLIMDEIQRLRGGIYLADGAVRSSELTADGRHETLEDEKSWHLVMLDRQGRVSSCAWCMEHEDPTSIEQLRVRHCPLNGAHPLRHRLQTAVTRELARARQAGSHH